MNANKSTYFAALPEDQQRFLVRWLSDNFIKTASVNRRHTAYGIKQPLSRLFFYVTEKQLEDAMRRAGFSVELNKLGKPQFNISEKSPAFALLRTTGAGLDWRSVYPE